MPETAVKIGTHGARDQEQADGEPEFQGGCDVNTAANQREYQRLRQIAKQRARKKCLDRMLEMPAARLVSRLLPTGSRRTSTVIPNG